MPWPSLIVSVSSPAPPAPGTGRDPRWIRCPTGRRVYRPLSGGGDVGERFSVDPPIEPMLAKPIAGLPESADGLAFQPKWDGFRVIVYRRGDDVVIQGRMRAADAAATGSWDLSYAFPEMVERIRGMRADDVVLDGELVVIREGRLAFDALQGRLRPRKEEGGWKIAQLAADFPTSFVAFDILAADGKDLRPAPFAERRAALHDGDGRGSASPAPHPPDRRPRRRCPVVRGATGRRPRRAHRPATRRGLRRRASARCSRSSRRTRWTWCARGGGRTSRPGRMVGRSSDRC